MIDEMRLVVQLAIGMVFLLSTPGKLIDPVGFARGVVEYQIGPKSLAFSGAMAVIVTEIFLAIAHLTGSFLRFAAPVGVVMLLIFSIAVAVNLKRGHALRCYCFGESDVELISGRTLVRLLLLLGGEILLITDSNLLTTNRIIHFDGIGSFAHLSLALFWAAFLLVAGGWLLSSGDTLEIFRTRTRSNRDR
jgi:hypothetical protein